MCFQNLVQPPQGLKGRGVGPIGATEGIFSEVFSLMFKFATGLGAVQVLC